MTSTDVDETIDQHDLEEYLLKTRSILVNIGLNQMNEDLLMKNTFIRMSKHFFFDFLKPILFNPIFTRYSSIGGISLIKNSFPSEKNNQSHFNQ